MFKHYFERIQNVELWPIISLVIFFLFFLALTLWAFRVDKRYINKMKKMPLEKDDAQPDDQ